MKGDRRNVVRVKVCGGVCVKVLRCRKSSGQQRSKQPITKVLQVGRVVDTPLYKQPITTDLAQPVEVEVEEHKGGI